MNSVREEYLLKTRISEMLEEMKTCVSSSSENPEQMAFDFLIKNESERIAFCFIRSNPKIALDDLARACIFLAKRAFTNVSVEDIQKISQNGGKKNTTWIALVPLILMANQD